MGFYKSINRIENDRYYMEENILNNNELSAYMDLSKSGRPVSLAVYIMDDNYYWSLTALDTERYVLAISVDDILKRKTTATVRTLLIKKINEITF